jgi:hypothetical protein
MGSRRAHPHAPLLRPSPADANTPPMAERDDADEGAAARGARRARDEITDTSESYDAQQEAAARFLAPPPRAASQGGTSRVSFTAPPRLMPWADDLSSETVLGPAFPAEAGSRLDPREPFGADGARQSFQHAMNASTLDVASIRLDPWRELTPAPEAEPAEGTWEEAEPYQGDGPFAAPLDAPAGSSPERGRASGFEASSAPRETERPASAASRAGHSEGVRARPGVIGASTPQLGGPLLIQRRTGKRAEVPSPPAMPSRPDRPASSLPPERRYPKMRALLADPDAALGAPLRARAQPVPGTFFPAARPPPERPAPADLDQLLATMAEGLLVGETPSGETEVRVTLRDEFFAGTELRIVAGAGNIRARLVPPDRSTYWSLNGNLHELEQRLLGRGLRVTELEVVEPGA